MEVVDTKSGLKEGDFPQKIKRNKIGEKKG